MVEVGETERLPFEPVPVPTNVPPQLPEYHFHDPQEPNEPPLTVNVEVPPTGILAGLADAEVGLVELVQLATQLIAACHPNQLPVEQLLLASDVNLNVN